MKVTFLTLLGLALIASSSHAATTLSLSATGTPSSDGWTSTVNEFNDAGNWEVFGTGGNAVYTFGDLAIGESASIDFQIVASVNVGSYVGVDFQDGGTTGIGFNFLGGLSEFGVFDGPGSGFTAYSGIGFTNSFQTVKLTNIDGTNYTLSVGTSDFTALTLANSTTSIDSIRVFNDTSGFGNDAAFNNLNVVPEPSPIALLSVGIIGWMARRRR